MTAPPSTKPGGTAPWYMPTLDDLDWCDGSTSIEPEPPAIVSPKPVPGSMKLLIEDMYEPLFLSATWSIVVKLNGRVVERSLTQDQTHKKVEVDSYAKSYIWSNKTFLQGIGVDVVDAYVKHGGNARDL
jgi:hypothetical protein